MRGSEKREQQRADEVGLWPRLLESRVGAADAGYASLSWGRALCGREPHRMLGERMGPWMRGRSKAAEIAPSGTEGSVDVGVAVAIARFERAPIAGP